MTDAPLAWQDWLEKYMAVATADQMDAYLSSILAAHDVQAGLEQKASTFAATRLAKAAFCAWQRHCEVAKLLDGKLQSMLASRNDQNKRRVFRRWQINVEMKLKMKALSKAQKTRKMGVAFSGWRTVTQTKRLLATKIAAAKTRVAAGAFYGWVHAVNQLVKTHQQWTLAFHPDDKSPVFSPVLTLSPVSSKDDIDIQAAAPGPGANNNVTLAPVDQAIDALGIDQLGLMTPHFRPPSGKKMKRICTVLSSDERSDWQLRDSTLTELLDLVREALAHARQADMTWLLKVCACDTSRDCVRV